MQNITLDELKKRVDSQFSGKDNNFLAVLLGTVDCQYCVQYREKLSSIEDEFLALDFEFVYLEIEDGFPLFAPPTLPSLVCFYQGVRVWEGIGMPKEILDVKEALLARFHGAQNWQG